MTTDTQKGGNSNSDNIYSTTILKQVISTSLSHLKKKKVKPTYFYTKPDLQPRHKVVSASLEHSTSRYAEPSSDKMRGYLQETQCSPRIKMERTKIPLFIFIYLFFKKNMVPLF